MVTLTEEQREDCIRNTLKYYGWESCCEIVNELSLSVPFADLFNLMLMVSSLTLESTLKESQYKCINGDV